MENEELAVKRESSDKKLDDEYLDFITEQLSKCDTKWDKSQLNSEVFNTKDLDSLVKNLTNPYYLGMKLKVEKQRRLSQHIWNSLSTFTIFPNTQVNDYLANTSLNISAHKSIASDWKKVGAQLWLSYLRQPEVKD